MKAILTLLLLGASSAIFGAPGDASTGSAEPAGFILLVLGLAALLLGMKNLRELRHKRMIPPRLARRRKTDQEQAPARER